MELRRRLARAFATAHPAEAAAVLEGRPTTEAVDVLSALPVASAAGVLHRMSSASARHALEELEPKRAAELISQLPLEEAATLLRRASEENRERLLECLASDILDDLQAVIGFPENTAGALMDPRALALHGDLTVEEALSAVQREPEHALYNLYVIDRNGVLIGVLNLLELLKAPPRERLDAMAQPAHHRLAVQADQQSILSHAGWRKIYSLPVVDAQEKFLGAVRYRTLRRVEDELLNVEAGPMNPTTSALGELFRTGIVGMIDALSGSVAGSPSAANEAPREGTREEAPHGNEGSE